VVTTPGRRITLVADQALGYHRTGGLGTATTHLAVALGRMGHDVDILYFGEMPAEPVDPEWAELYASAGVRIRPLPPYEAAVEPSYFRRMRAVELALRADPPHVAIVQDLGAPAYTALRARQLGLELHDTLFVVYCHGTRQWITNMARKVRVLPGALAVSRLEQAGVELADVAISPSAYMIAWMREQGWRLPHATGVIPLLTRTAATGEPLAEAGSADGGKVERLVFFGRFEERKGIRPFAAGLNALPSELLEGIELEFVGRDTTEFSPEQIEALLEEPVRTALRSVSFETGLDQAQALERLARPGTLAVMPSLEDNSPNVVYECVELGIPFLASRLGGTPELVAEEDRDRVLLDPTAEGVAEALERTLTSEDALRPVAPGFDGAVGVRRWGEVVAMRTRDRSPEGEQPAVDVVIVRNGSPELVDRCVSAVAAQTYEGVRDPIVVDDREAGLEKAEAEWVVILAGDDVPAPRLVETLVRAQASTQADAVSCGITIGEGRKAIEHLFGGDAGGLGVLANDYGGPALLRRALVRDRDERDWTLLARLGAEGARIVSVPEVLVRRRSKPETIVSDPADALHIVDRVDRELPPQLRGLAVLAAGAAADAIPGPQPEPSPVRRALRRLRRGA
jgi:O-antigen biosynthesis protein